MITHRLTLSVAGKERPLVICADHCVVTESDEIQFYDATDHLIATVPSSTIIEHTES